MATWDVFRSDRLEIERALTTEAVRAALARGELHDDDLIRPAGTTVAWARLADLPTLVEPPLPPRPPTPPPADDELELLEDSDAAEDLEASDRPEPHEDAATAAVEPVLDADLGRLDLDPDLGAGSVRAASTCRVSSWSAGTATRKSPTRSRKTRKRPRSPCRAAIPRGSRSSTWRRWWMSPSSSSSSSW